ncbi:MAG: ABC transporter ATP-binding protein [Nitrosarchaeum sp.]|nr:ABC transporter ATP-binding protein [Nitrosarchaeum sp.]
MAEKKKREIDYWYNLREYWGLLSKYKGKYVGVLLVVLLTEAAYVADNLLFKVIVDEATALEAGGLPGTFVQVLLVVATVFATLALFRSFFKFVQLHLLNRLETDLIVDLKRRYFNHIAGLSHGFHVSNKTGSLISRLTRGGSAVERLTDVAVFNAAPLIFKLVVATSALMYFNVAAGLITVATIIAYVTFSLLVQNWQASDAVRSNDAEDAEKAKIADYFSNIDSIKYFGKEALIRRRFSALADRSRSAARAYWDWYRITDAGQALILSVGVFLLVWVSARSMLRGEISVGTLVFIYSSFGSLIGPLFGFLFGIRTFYQAMADLEVLFAYGKVEQEVKNLPSARNFDIRKGSIEYRNVTFSYGKRGVISGLNLRIQPRTKVALVGHSGCGKTTLVKLLYRLYDVQSGVVLVDGRDVRDYVQEHLRSQMSIVLRIVRSLMTLSSTMLRLAILRQAKRMCAGRCVSRSWIRS